MGRPKLTIEYVKNYVLKTGETLISTVYVGAHSKLEFQCKEGHLYNMPWGGFKRENRCRVCDAKARALTIEDVRNRVSKTKEKLISPAYTNSWTELEFECRYGHHYKMPWRSFQQGKRCAKCAGNAKHTYAYILKEVMKTTENLISTEYVNSNGILEFECQYGHRYLMRWYNFKTGYRCSSCVQRGFNSSKPSVLYYIRIEHRGRRYYKIGVTNRSVEDRYPSSDFEKITTLKTWKHKMGSTSYKKEQLILKKYSDHRYRGNAKVLKTGMTEVFSTDVLGLDIQ